MKRNSYRIRFVPSGTLAVLLGAMGACSIAEAQSYYVPNGPISGSATVAPIGCPPYAPQYVYPSVWPGEVVYFEGCTPCLPDPVVSREPTPSGWRAAPPSETSTSDASRSTCEPSFQNRTPYGRFPELQNMEPIREREPTSAALRSDFAINDDHPLLRPFQGTYGPVAPTFATMNVRDSLGGTVASNNPNRDVSRPVEATIVSNPTEERSSVAWSGSTPPWLREPPSISSGVDASLNSEQPARSADDVLQRYGGVARFDEPVQRR